MSRKTLRLKKGRHLRHTKSRRYYKGGSKWNKRPTVTRKAGLKNVAKALLLGYLQSGYKPWEPERYKFGQLQNNPQNKALILPQEYSSAVATNLNPMWYTSPPVDWGTSPNPNYVPPTNKNKQLVDPLNPALQSPSGNQLNLNSIPKRYNWMNQTTLTYVPLNENNELNGNMKDSLSYIELLLNFVSKVIKDRQKLREIQALAKEVEEKITEYIPKLPSKLYLPDIFDITTIIENMKQRLTLIGEGSFGKVYDLTPITGKAIIAKHISLPDKYNNPELYENRFLATIRELYNLYDFSRNPELMSYVPFLFHEKGWDNSLKQGLIHNWSQWQGPGAIPIKGVVIVEEKIMGTSLANVIENRGVTQEESNWLMKEISTGLDLIHKNGIVHSDVKPANIQVRLHNNEIVGAVFLDFGGANKIGYPVREYTPSYIPQNMLINIYQGKSVKLTPEMNNYAKNLIGGELERAVVPPEQIKQLPNQIPVYPRPWEQNPKEAAEHLLQRVNNPLPAPAQQVLRNFIKS